jgi:hypothetical protein
VFTGIDLDRVRPAGDRLGLDNVGRDGCRREDAEGEEGSQGLEGKHF